MIDKKFNSVLMFCWQSNKRQNICEQYNKISLVFFGFSPIAVLELKYNERNKNLRLTFQHLEF